MKLFLSQRANILSENPQEKLSKLIEVFANYVRAPQRSLVSINMVSEADQQALKISQVSTLDFALITQNGHICRKISACTPTINLEDAPS